MAIVNFDDQTRIHEINGVFDAYGYLVDSYSIKVHQGDTLESIAQYFGLSKRTLRRSNSALYEENPNPILEEGQVLKYRVVYGPGKL